MNLSRSFLTFFICVLLILTACTKEDPSLLKINKPPSGNDCWNGFTLNKEEYETPNAIIEIYGENLDSLSSDYDLSFTDGVYDLERRNITGDSILMYFDANSPSLVNLSPGTYFVEITNERKPGNIVDAYLQIRNKANTVRYPILSGTVRVIEENGLYVISYELEGMINHEIVKIEGSYEGSYTIIDQRKI